MCLDRLFVPSYWQGLVPPPEWKPLTIATKERLLLALHVLACYQKNAHEGAACSCTYNEKTYCKWVWYLIQEICYVEDFFVSGIWQ